MQGKTYVKPATIVPRDKKQKPYLLKIRQPERSHRHIPDEGAWVPNNRYYRMHIREESLVEATPPKKPAKKPQENKS